MQLLGCDLGGHPHLAFGLGNTTASSPSRLIVVVPPCVAARTAHDALGDFSQETRPAVAHVGAYLETVVTLVVELEPGRISFPAIGAPQHRLVSRQESTLLGTARSYRFSHPGTIRRKGPWFPCSLPQKHGYLGPFLQCGGRGLRPSVRAGGRQLGRACEQNHTDGAPGHHTVAEANACARCWLGFTESPRWPCKPHRPRLSGAPAAPAAGRKRPAAPTLAPSC